MKLHVIQIAALGWDFLNGNSGGPRFAGLEFKPIHGVFPALTCTAQASLRTGAPPSSHGIVGNGFYNRDFGRPMFWEQSSALVEGPRIWDEFRTRGGKVGQMFFQQSLGTDSDIIISPAPIHKHHGGMIQDCYSRPAGLYRSLVKKTGRAFNLRHYWGPLASVKSSRWIADAAAFVMRDQSPDLLLTYIPHLDYELQRYGPQSEKSARALAELGEILGVLLEESRKSGYKTIAFGDYAITPVSGAVFPNRILRESGFFAIRNIRGMEYPDQFSSRAFAVADHQIAHVVIKNPADVPLVKVAFDGVDGIAGVLDSDGKRKCGLDHPRSGELVLVSTNDRWFAYPWWTGRSAAPDYAAHVDIHNKPGYDPCELFFGFWPISISTDASKIRGSHGLVGPGFEAAYSADFDVGGTPENLLGLSHIIKDLLGK
jgi:hypothetical protein